jgi:streptomycin 6-kinase
MSVVLAVDSADGPGVLKLAAPWARWSAAEAAALLEWDGSCAPRLWRASADSGALLMERIVPGDRPPPLRPSQAAGLLRRLSVPPRSPRAQIPPLTEAVETRFERGRENRHGLISPEQLARAATAALDLAAEPQPVVLAHGDFLRKNLLLRGGDGEIVAIDPTPALGDPCYDVALWVVTEDPVAAARERCADVAALLALDPERVWRWALVLGAVEVSLASELRARATRELIDAASPAWW